MKLLKRKNLKKKKALITGITGQDGSYLAEFLIEKGYEVHGFMRKSSPLNSSIKDRMLHHPNNTEKILKITYGDLSDASCISHLIESIRPDEIYNLAAQSHVRDSFDIPEYTANITALGTIRLLDAIKKSGVKTKFYQASSSEMFGKAQETPQNENTSFYPQSPYAIAKLFSYWMTRNYREAYGIFAVNGILFNHESPRRGNTYVTKKITRGLVRIKNGVDEKLYLGNLEARRDWGHAKDYVYGMWLMLQQDQPGDYVLATGETHSVREFVEESAKCIGIDIAWKEKGIRERGIDKKTGKTIIEIDPKYFRPTEVDLLIGDASKAKKELGWKPEISFKELVKMMCKHDMKEEKPKK